MSKLGEKLQYLGQLHPKRIDLTLGRILQLLDKLDNPQLRVPPVIHVAGTNGKGSTIAFMRAMCEAAGLCVHAYTSPHLIHFNERIRLAGALVDDETLLAVLDAVEAANAGAPITFFEITTAAAFVLFSRVPADVLLLEVGLGGRLDSTNVVEPAVSVITRISMDHMEFLGNTIAQIAGEKAGIMKPSVPCVIGYQADEAAREVFRARAAELGCPLYEYGRDFSAAELPNGFLYFPPPLRHSAGRTRPAEPDPLPQGEGKLNIAPSPLAGEGWGGGGIKLPLPALLGAHQILNAAAAITAVKLFSERITDEHIRIGLQTAAWPGRLERITHGTIAALLPRDFELWYDGAHNDSGADALAEQCRRWQGQGYDIHLVLGMLATKNPAVFAPVIAAAKTITTIPVPADTPAYSAAELAAQISAFASVRPYAAASIEQAIHHIIPAIRPARPPLVLVSGSLYLAQLLA